MKISQITRVILFLTVAMLSISSCEKDEVNSNQNSLTIDGAAFEITTASIIGVSIDGDGHAGVNFMSVSESGSKSLAIDIEYSTDQPIEGDYAYPQSGDARLIDDWLTNYTEISGTTSNSTNLQTGTLNIVHNGGNNYTVKMNLTMVDGKVFSGTYTGEFLVQFNNG